MRSFWFLGVLCVFLVQCANAKNYFVAIRIRSDKLVSKANEMQLGLLQRNANFAQTLQPLRSIHVTVAQTTGLDENGHQKVRKALKNAAREFRKNGWGKLKVHVDGVDEFGGSVLYMSVKLWKGLRTLHDLVADALHEEGIQNSEPNPYVPHISVVRLRGKGGGLSGDWQYLKGAWPKTITDQVDSMALCDYGVDWTHRETAEYKCEEFCIV